ncbi:ABC transporter permease subunit [Salinispirillum marinum]|uniref:ABC transporter permease subunit n=2 Tax=Saccharospirillaceae TaxID=255527 RepID=A0ABV8BF92_9GAMM
MTYVIPPYQSADAARSTTYWSGLAGWVSWLAMGTLLSVSGIAVLALWGGQQAGAQWTALQDPWLWRVLRFTLWQAALSAALSVLFALPVARAVALDEQLRGTKAFLRWCLLCFVMPSLVLITGMVVLFGRSGILTPWLGSDWSLYGLSGILLAHVFLNMPFAIRVLTFQWQSIPSTAWKLAAQFQLSSWQRFRWVEWPALRGVLPAAFGLIFLLCFNSFAVVLTLGGGPRATTLEVAIYQALKYNFNPQEALILAAIQLLVAGGFFVLFNRFGKLSWVMPATGLGWRPRLSGLERRAGQWVYGLAIVFLTAPVLALLVVVSRVNIASLPWLSLLISMGYSLLFALSAALFSLLLALSCLALWRRQPSARRRQWVDGVALHHLVIPGMVLSVGLYIFFMPWVNWQRWGWLAVVGLNALVALPFVYSHLKPRVHEYDAQYGRVAADLGLTGWPHWRRTILPKLWPAVQRAFAISFVLALGDFALFGIFGHDRWQTLPWLIYGLTGAYRLADAAFAALLLLALAWFALWSLERSYARR